MVAGKFGISAGGGGKGMKWKCTKCGHVDEIKDLGRSKGGKARVKVAFKGLTKKQISERMKAVRRGKKKNTEVRDGGLPPFSGPPGSDPV